MNQLQTKYLIIGAERFDDEESMYDLVVYYTSIKDEVNSFKYCNMLCSKIHYKVILL